MNGFETAILIVLGAILIILLALTIGALVLLWRLRKAVMVITLALRGVSRLNRQLRRFSDTLDENQRQKDR